MLAILKYFSFHLICLFLLVFYAQIILFLYLFGLHIVQTGDLFTLWKYACFFTKNLKYLLLKIASKIENDEFIMSQEAATCEGSERFVFLFNLLW